MQSIVKQVRQGNNAKTSEEKQTDNNVSLDASDANKDATSISNKIIKLNVGGQRFITTSRTLGKYDNSYFHGLISKKFGHQMVDKDYIFIDRNGKLFEYILDYLRSGYVEIPDNKCNQISNELDFYSLPLKVVYIPPKFHNVEIIDRSTVYGQRGHEFLIQCFNEKEYSALGLKHKYDSIRAVMRVDSNREWVQNENGEKMRSPEQVIEYLVKQFGFLVNKTAQQNPCTCDGIEIMQKVYVLSPSPSDRGKWCLTHK